MIHKESPNWGMTNPPESGYAYSIGGDGPERGVVQTDRLSYV
jgi:hypothetical protein